MRRRPPQESADGISERRLDDGRTYRIPKVFYAPDEIREALERAGIPGHDLARDRALLPARRGHTVSDLGIGRVGVWGTPGLPGCARCSSLRSARRDLGYGALWVPETVGREPFTLLGMLIDETAIRLGTSIASIYARDAVTMRTAAMTLHEASGGRFVLGLGVSHPHLVTKVRGHEYGKPVSTLRDYLATYRAAPWRGPRLSG